jgi:photosynthetic reaction center cytochrome c subunit
MQRFLWANPYTPRGGNTVIRVSVPLCLCVFVIHLTLAATPQAQRPQMAEEVFKNVQVLKGIPVDEFMNTMGVFSAALGMSCEDCHAANDAKWENYALDTSPKKRMARRMVQMVTTINKDNFSGRQMVTCWSCHRGSDRPKVTPDLSTLYNRPDEADDVITAAPGAPPADQILDKYIQALGGSQRVASLTSFIAKGTSAGYGPEGMPRPVEIYAKAPNQRTTIIHTQNGDSTTVFDGGAGWIAAPLRPVPLLTLSGSGLEGLRLDAELAFPGRIKELLKNWRVGFPATINEREAQVIQGTAPGGSLATLFFDIESGLLVRTIRYSESVVGRTPTQIDYSDYREVRGFKFPFRFTVTWLDGKENFELTEVQPNASIDPAKFARPR